MKDARIEMVADTLMDLRMDGPWSQPPSTKTYQEAMRHYAETILRVLDGAETAAEACAGELAECRSQLASFRGALRVDGAWSYDEENHWIVFTDDGGASAIVAFDVQPQWALRLFQTPSLALVYGQLVDRLWGCDYDANGVLDLFDSPTSPASMQSDTRA
jgi:hypothetical protein